MLSRSFLTVLLVLATATPALCEKPKKKSKKKSDATVTFSAEQQDVVRVFFAEKHGRGNCPPGLAKKNNGCLPPGQAKKRYAVGRPLPASLELLPVPVELSVRIGPAPAGYRYAVVDGDLVKLVVGTLLVVDAIDGLVH